jgi:hypothetical protein
MKKPADYPRFKPEEDAGNVWGGRRCIAWSRQNGQRCKAPAMRGRNVCRMHGGKSLQGFAHPGLKDGWYSKDFFAGFDANAIRYAAKRRKRMAQRLP